MAVIMSENSVPTLTCGFLQPRKSTILEIRPASSENFVAKMPPKIRGLTVLKADEKSRNKILEQVQL